MPRAADLAPRPQAAAVGTWSSGRHLYVDNLKVLLIAAIIAGHGIVSYASMELWAYTDVREVTLSTATQVITFALVMPFGLFLVPLLFLVAGLLTPASVGRKGPARYARDRLLRLGLPLAVFTLLVWPALLYALYATYRTTPPGSYWAELVGTAEAGLDTGYLWFVAVLLLFSLAYAGWGGVRSHPARRAGVGDIRLAHLSIVAVAVAVSTFLVRLVFPFDSERYIVLHFYQWPECAAMFGLGIVAASRGWLIRVPDRLGSQCRTVLLATVVGFGAFVVVGVTMGGVGGGGVGEEVWAGGWHWEAAVFAALESTLAVSGPIWLLGVAQRRLERPMRWATPAVSRSAYGAFLLQGVLLLGLAVALRAVPLPAELKALLVASGGVAGSFALAWFLIRRVPGVGHIL